MVRVAAEKLPDAIRLPVRQTQSAVQWLICDLRQVMQSSLRSR